MNFEKFKSYFENENLPLELGYGYTLERSSLHIVLFENKISRVVVDSYGNTLERVDMKENVSFQKLIENQKRFYPNRIHSTFVSLMKDFNCPLSITNTDSKSEIIYEFNPVIDKLPVNQIPKKYAKVKDSCFVHDRYMNGLVPMFDFMIDYNRMFEDVYVIFDARWIIHHFEQDYEVISEEEYISIKSRWEEQNSKSGYQIKEFWTFIDKNGIYVDVSDSYEEIMKWREEYLRHDNYFYPTKKGYCIIGYDNFVVDGTADFYMNYAEAFQDFTKLINHTIS